MIFHILTAEGDLKDVYAIPTEYTPMWGNGDVRDNIYKSLEEMSAIISNLQVRALKITTKIIRQRGPYFRARRTIL